MNYFESRMISSSSYNDYKTPLFLKQILLNKDWEILDFGCGQGQFLLDLLQLGYRNLTGVDIFDSNLGIRSDLNFINLTKEPEWLKLQNGKFDFILISHVLEHIEKANIVNLLKELKNALKPGGVLFIQVPNAQSLSGAYWAYEDFTHHTLFTSGSLYYVLVNAGFQSIEFYDVDSLIGLNFPKKMIRKIFFKLLRLKTKILFRIFDNYFHAPSPSIFTYEIKAICRN